MIQNEITVKDVKSMYGLEGKIDFDNTDRLIQSIEFFPDGTISKILFVYL